MDMNGLTNDHMATRGSYFFCNGDSACLPSFARRTAFAVVARPRPLFLPGKAYCTTKWCIMRSIAHNGGQNSIGAPFSPHEARPCHHAAQNIWTKARERQKFAPHEFPN